ncbi:MAG: ABC transporter ATP-binding protein [Bacteroidetes bacterium]|nr:ABC transporter ATP-binding protein [Bacteroidota bacterium]
MNAFLEISHCVIGRKEALIQSFSNIVESGNVVILTGKNGSGKSTLLKTIAGLILPISGQIKYNNQSIHAFTFAERAKLIAFVNTHKLSDEYIKVIDLVTLGRYPFNEKYKHSEITEKALATLGISHLANKYINEISDGEFQKANIARALAQDTPIILLDEPSAFLDYPSKKELFFNLQNIAVEEHKIIICPTHDIELSKTVGTLFWHLENGIITETLEQIAWI